MRTIKNLDWQVMIDLVQLSNAHHPAKIPHQAARDMLGKHLGARSVTHVVQRLQAEGLVLEPVKPPKPAKATPEQAAQPEPSQSAPAPEAPPVDQVEVQPVSAPADEQTPAQDGVGA